MSVRDLIIMGCSSQQPTRLRNHGGYLLRWNGEGFLFDPGEGTQRQFIFAEVAPTAVTRIFISHFHGDHCLGLGSMLMRLNLDRIEHDVHCYYPASGKKYFDRLRFGTIYHNKVNVIEHLVDVDGVVHDDGEFCIEAKFLHHGVDNLGWAICEKEKRRFYKQKLKQYGIQGSLVKKLEEKGYIDIDGERYGIEAVSYIQRGKKFIFAVDTLPCPQVEELAVDADLALMEATYLHQHEQLACQHFHMTALQTATLAQKAGVKQLVLTHFSARYRDLQPFLEEAQTAFKGKVDYAEDFKRIVFE